MTREPTSEQDQIYILSQATKEFDGLGNKSYPVYQSDGVTGSFTGVKIGSTVIPRRGRGLLTPGVRIFDMAQLKDKVEEEYRKSLIKQNKQTNG